MEIWLDEDLLKSFHEYLVQIYRDTDYPITIGHSEGMLHVCIERPSTGIYGFIPFPHLLHKATVLMETIVNFHPFADGNKRVALLATFYFLYWNGYVLEIPEDADEFTIGIAKGIYNLNRILSWLVHHCRRDYVTVFINLLCGICITIWNMLPQLHSVVDVFVPLFFPPYPFMYLGYALRRKRRKFKHNDLTQKT